MKNNFLIVGLGNPGKNFLKTRHNIGFMVVDRILNWFEIPVKKTPLFVLGERHFLNYERKVKAFFMKPLTYMNRSGEAVREFFRDKNIEDFDIIAVHDDIDMRPAKLRIKSKGSHGGHNGVKSLISVIGEEFKRVKIGIGKPENRDMIPDYVLGEFETEELELISKSIDRASYIVVSLLFNPVERVQNFVN